MRKRSSAFEKSCASPHRRRRSEPEMRFAPPALDGPSGPIPTLEELLNAVDLDGSWRSGQLLKDCEADPFR